MFPRSLLIAKGGALLAAVLLAAPSAQAQTSPSGHVPARTAYGSSSRVGAQAFRIFPGDHMFQAAMKIEHYYQTAARTGSVVAYHPPARRSPARLEAAAPVEVSISEPEDATEMVTIRGPDGKARFFPIAGGRKAIKVRTLIVRPGQSLNLMIRGGRVEVLRK